MNEAKLRERVKAIVREEIEDDARWWYISWATETEFLGAALICAPGFVSATVIANAAGLNPGGQALGWDATSVIEETDKKYRGRLLSRQELTEAGLI